MPSRGRTLLVAASLLASAAAQADTGADPTHLVDRLADDAQRAAARERLVALRGAAVPAITAKLATASDALFVDLVTILEELGPEAGSAFPELVTALVDR